MGLYSKSSNADVNTNFTRTQINSSVYGNVLHKQTMVCAIQPLNSISRDINTWMFNWLIISESSFSRVNIVTTKWISWCLQIDTKIHKFCWERHILSSFIISIIFTMLSILFLHPFVCTINYVQLIFILFLIEQSDPLAIINYRTGI